MIIDINACYGQRENLQSLINDTVQIDHTTPDKHKIQANKIKDLRTQTPTTKTRGENTNSHNKNQGREHKISEQNSGSQD